MITMNTICKKCGSHYNPLESNASQFEIYCSLACEHASDAVCQHCQKHYLIDKSSAYHKESYCSESCEDLEHLVCERCGTTYSSNTSDAYNDVAFCSKACEDGKEPTSEIKCSVCQRYYEEATSSAKAQHLYCDFLCEERATEQGMTPEEPEQTPVVEESIAVAPVSQPKKTEPIEKLDRIATTLEEQPTKPFSPVKEYNEPQIPRHTQPEKAKKGLFGKKPISFAQNHGANGEPKLSGRALRNEWYNYKTKRFIVTWIIFTVVYLYFMKDFTTISNSFSQSTGKGILYIVLLAASIIFALRAILKVLRGIIMGPVKRFKAYMALILTFIVICILQQVILGSVFAMNAVFESVEFGKTTNDFIQELLPWIQSLK